MNLSQELDTVLASANDISYRLRRHICRTLVHCIASPGLTCEECGATITIAAIRQAADEITPDPQCPDSVFADAGKLIVLCSLPLDHPGLHQYRGECGYVVNWERVK